MAAARYRGLAEFGLPLISQDDPSFADLARNIENGFGPDPSESSRAADRAAVLLNNTGKAIIAIEWLWRYTSRDGKTQTSHCTNLGSSAQREVLIGRSKPWRDLGTFILPGSSRLITESGMFGNNLDVLTPEEMPQSLGYCGGWGGGSRVGAETHLAAVELVLDLVILEDGLCVGPNEFELYEALNQSLDLQRTAAQEALAALQRGASVGQIFEIVRPLARQRPPERRPGGKARQPVPILATFGNEAVHRLINATEPEIVAFFEKAAEPRTLQLRRPE